MNGLYLPPLREELAIWPGPMAHDGQPSWTIQDPARNRFFRIDWLTFEVLQRWSLREPELIARNIGEQTPLRAVVGDVIAVLEFLATHQLLKLAGADTSAQLARNQARLRPGVGTWLVHNYLFFRVPLVRPERLLAWLHERLGILFSPWFWRLVVLAAIGGLVLVARQWAAFAGTWHEVANLHGAVSFLAVIMGVKVIHELGHGLAATHFGCRVPTMGVAFLVMTPVAYTDVNDAWKLAERRPRLLIGAAGMLAELLIAVAATLAWVSLPDGYLRSAAFIVATTTWVKSIVVNTSPVMRFDGYYLLSDFLDIPNLHTRAFALARWQLREWLFAFDEPPPERFRRPLARGLVGLAFFIWVYRLVVFVGIAVFVYHAFFKALGIVLFAIEIGWFVALPIVSEMKAWAANRARILRSRRARWTFGGLGLAVMLLLVPWPRRVHAQGELSPEREFRIVAPAPAVLVRMAVADGARVAAGAPLLELASVDLDHRVALANARAESLRGQLLSAESDPAMRGKVPTIRAAVAAADAARREAEVARASLSARAPFAGVFRLGNCDLRPGEGIERQEEIACVRGDGAWQVVAYVDEGDSHLISAGASASFLPDGCPDQRVPLHVVGIDRDAARTISRPALTSMGGGLVPATLVDGALVPNHGVYRVLLRADGVDAELATVTRRGRVVIRGGAESLGGRFARAAGAVVWREAGF